MAERKNDFIQELEEIQQYRAIGTIEELQFLKQWKSDVMEEFCKYDASSVEEIVLHARNRAITEFAERMKELSECGEISVFGWNRIIDEIAEEMKGET